MQPGRPYCVRGRAYPAINTQICNKTVKASLGREPWLGQGWAGTFHLIPFVPFACGIVQT